MIMAGAGGPGRRGKFSKTKGKKDGLPKFNTALQINIKATSLIIMPFGATSLVLTSKTALKHQLQGMLGGACRLQLLAHKLVNLPFPPALVWLVPTILSSCSHLSRMPPESLRILNQQFFSHWVLSEPFLL